MFRILSSVNSLALTTVVLVSSFIVLKYDHLFQPVRSEFNVRTKEEEFAEKLKAEANKRSVVGYVSKYGDRLAQGEIQGLQEDFDAVKDWISANSTPAEGETSFSPQMKVHRRFYNTFKIRKPV